MTDRLSLDSIDFEMLCTRQPMSATRFFTSLGTGGKRSTVHDLLLGARTLYSSKTGVMQAFNLTAGLNYIK